MQKYVVHLYEKLSNIPDDIKLSEECISLSPSPVIGIVSNNSLEKPSRKTLINGLNLRPFEIIQNQFDLFIKRAKRFGVKIQEIEFTEEIDIENEEGIETSIQDGNYEELLRIVKDIRRDNIDIFAISYLYEGKPQRMSKYAVAEMLGEEDEIPQIILNSPLSVIAGLRQIPSSYRH